MPGKGFRITKYNDKQIISKMERASLFGIDQTMGLCIAPAKRETPVVTGTAQGSIQMRPSKRIGNFIVGIWGSFDVDYFIWLEIGARGRTGIHMLRRAADRFYPGLADRIRHRFAA